MEQALFHTLNRSESRYLQRIKSTHSCNCFSQSVLHQHLPHITSMSKIYRSALTLRPRGCARSVAVHWFCAYLRVVQEQASSFGVAPISQNAGWYRMSPNKAPKSDQAIYRNQEGMYEQEKRFNL